MRNETPYRKSAPALPGYSSTLGSLIKRGQVKRQFDLGQYRATLLGRIESASLTDYLFVMAVYTDRATDPCLIVTSEVNADCWNIGGGSHFLRVFYRDVAKNMGASDDWANLEKFTSKALTIAASELSVLEAPREMVSTGSKRESGMLSAPRAL